MKHKFNTKALHGGYTPSGADRSRVVPLHQSVAYLFSDTKEAAALFEGKQEGFIYGRINNPTVDIFEKRMAELEGAEAGLGTSSGMAAIFMIAAHLAQSGDEIVSSNRVYGGTFHLFCNTLPRFGIKVRFVNAPNKASAWESKINKKTKFLFVETPSNPKSEVFDVTSIAKIAHSHRLPLAVDSTVATPVFLNPIALGADIVIHSATKYISGNSTALGGIVLGKKKMIDDMRAKEYRDIGPSMSPFNAWLLLLGLETLPTRMERHSANAADVAGFLNNHPKVKAVHYAGFSSLMALEVRGGRKEGAKFIESLKLVSHAAHLGDSRTLAIHPASTTHQQLPKRDLKKIGISESMIRMSVGLEDIDDIIGDIKQALSKI